MPGPVVKGTLKGLKTFWQWSVPYKSSHRPDDGVYSAVWASAVDKDTTLDILKDIFPDIPRHELPHDEEHIRHLIRGRLLPPNQENFDDATTSSREKKTPSGSSHIPTERQEANKKLLEDVTEEAWMHVPPKLRHLLAAMNAHHLQEKLEATSRDNFHPPAGRKSIERSIRGMNKTFRMWRDGYKAAISQRERYLVKLFFIFLALSAIYPDVAAGFLGERSYNQRSIGMRIATLWQLFYLWTFPFPCFWLLFNWSLERLLGALVGNTVYALAALVPVIRAAYSQSWFRSMMLAMSLCWQIGVQFYSAARDYFMQRLAYRQMTGLRQQRDAEDADWKAVDKAVVNELTTLKTFLARPPARDNGCWAWQHVPMRVRIERYIQFTSCFKLGRPADQLVGLVKDDLEAVINTYEGYRSTAPRAGGKTDGEDGHVEPRVPKFLLVVFDVAIFAYVCYSFFPQPFTFNTVVAYGTVVTIKQTIVALKRYQTPKSARRLFTNMSAVNIIGVLLVSTPVTVDPGILDDNGKFIALTLAMTFATLFLAEPIAPLLLSVTDKAIKIWGRWTSRLTCKRLASPGHANIECDSAKVGDDSCSEKFKM